MQGSAEILNERGSLGKGPKVVMSEKRVCQQKEQQTCPQDRTRPPRWWHFFPVKSGMCHIGLGGPGEDFSGTNAIPCSPEFLWTGCETSLVTPRATGHLHVAKARLRVGVLGHAVFTRLHPVSQEEELRPAEPSGPLVAPRKVARGSPVGCAYGPPSG